MFSIFPWKFFKTQLLKACKVKCITVKKAIFCIDTPSYYWVNYQYTSKTELYYKIVSLSGLL